MYTLYEKADIYKDGQINFKNLNNMSDNVDYLENYKIQMQNDDFSEQITSLSKKSEKLDESKI